MDTVHNTISSAELCGADGTCARTHTAQQGHYRRRDVYLRIEEQECVFKRYFTEGNDSISPTALRASV